jgi:hypothetical protein
MRIKMAPMLIAFTFQASSVALGDGACKKCIADKLEGTGQKVALGALLGAAGGAAGLLPGAACGAVLGAATAAVDELVEVSKCNKICSDEAKARKDTQAGKCDELMRKVSK